ncbi:MAG: 5-deoxyadenosylcobinamide phosphate nucleotidyltransferase, partial [Methanomicrobium sp.]|nr:5-deoxyadenosylcobinamide phosphate nucleotidyltransferase [Methanomicrobium sp.]
CQYSESVDGIEACPCGLNIFDGSSPSVPQNELKILLNEPALTFNVNTPEELIAAEEFFGKK